MLVVHLKRFEHNADGRGGGRKLDRFVRFPLEELDLSPYVQSAQRDTPYVAASSAGAGRAADAWTPQQSGVVV